MGTIKRHRLFLLSLFIGLTVPQLGYGGFKCWTNKDGVRECGDAVPPEYAQQETRTVNEQGVIVDVQKRAKTKEELAAETRRQQEEEERRARENKRRQEQAAADRVLLSTFASEKDITSSRDRKLAALDASIELTRSSIDKLEEKLEQYRKQAANLERRGKPLPDQLRQDMATVQQQIDNKHAYIETKHEEQTELRAKYDADLRRFRELMGARRP